MSDLATLANMAEVLGVIIVVGGLYFAVQQIRQFRQQRRELAAIELFRFFGNAQFTQAFRRLLRLPDGISAAELRSDQYDLEDEAMLVSTTIESIGVMTFQRIVPFVIVNNLVGSSIVILWRKLGPWIAELRGELDDDAAFEWFQWLAERLQDYQPRMPDAAYIAHKDWIPAHLRREI